MEMTELVSKQKKESIKHMLRHTDHSKSRLQNWSPKKSVYLKMMLNPTKEQLEVQMSQIKVYDDLSAFQQSQLLRRNYQHQSNQMAMFVDSKKQYQFIDIIKKYDEREISKHQIYPKEPTENRKAE